MSGIITRSLNGWESSISSKDVISPRWINSARRACKGSSSSPCTFLRKLTTITAIAPMSTMAPKIRKPVVILYLDISDFHHHKVTGRDHTDNCGNSDDTAKRLRQGRALIKESSDIFRADEPKSRCQENRRSE